MRKLRVGIMGCASIAKRYVIPALRSMPEYEVRAIASRDGEKARTFTGEFGGEPVSGYDQLVDRADIDVVYVPLPTGLHAVWVEKLLHAGKHVMVEKSLATTASEADALIALARSQNLVLMEHFQFLHHRQTAFVQQQLAEGAIGDIQVMRASFGFPPLDAGNFRYKKDLGGGALLDAGAYTLRATQLYLGSRLRVKAAVLRSEGHGDVDTRGAALLESDMGVVSEVAWGFNHFYQCSVEIWGKKGRILQDRAFTAPPGYSPKVIIETEGLRKEYQLGPDNHFVNLWRAFYSQVANGGGDNMFQAVATQAHLIENVRTCAGTDAPI